MGINKNDFHLWLDQWVWVTGNDKIKRRDYIPYFAEEVTEFMRICGYTMNSRWKKGELIIAKWMYSIHVQEFVENAYNGILKYPAILHRNWQEDHDEYLHILSSDRVCSFMERWRLYEDFDHESRIGQRMIYELVDLLYPYIDMDGSKNGQRIAEILYETESDSESWKSGHRGRGKKDDIYITDAREGYHGGGFTPIA